MPLVVTCSQCKQRYILSEQERAVFHKVVKTQEDLDQIMCPDCESEVNWIECTYCGEEFIENDDGTCPHCGGE
jgi:DNA-directed RNA polymerase subunit RPC12/RpoP